jgi:invasion protein IalB
MTPIRRFRPILPLVVAGLFALPAGALAQTGQPAPKPAAPKPAAAAKPAAAPAQATAAPALTAQATLLGQFGDWSAYTATPGGRKVCFALAKPASSQDNPPNRRTAANVVYMFISSRPAEKVKDELSILVTGYAFKPSTEASMAIGSASFPMYTQNDGAWVKNAAEEAQLVDAMRKGADAVIKATTSKGTKTTDTFSLKGISQALERVGQECQ